MHTVSANIGRTPPVGSKLPNQPWSSTPIGTDAVYQEDWISISNDKSASVSRAAACRAAKHYNTELHVLP